MERLIAEVKNTAADCKYFEDFHDDKQCRSAVHDCLEKIAEDDANLVHHASLAVLKEIVGDIDGGFKNISKICIVPDAVVSK